MKLFRILKKEEKQDIPQIEQKEENIDFTDSMFSDIEEMKLKLENIKSELEIYEELKSLINGFEKYIEKSSEVIEERKIEEQLRSINESNIILNLETEPVTPQSTKDRVKQELTIEDYYKNIKAVYDAKYKKAMQKIYMEKVEKFNSYIDKVLIGENNKKITEQDIGEIKIYFGILKQKKEEFVGIMQNRYIEKLIELEYRINIMILKQYNCAWRNRYI